MLSRILLKKKYKKDLIQNIQYLDLTILPLVVHQKNINFLTEEFNIREKMIII